MKTAELIEPEQVTETTQNVIHLPLGLLGFEQIKNYALVSNPDEAPFLWLKVMDNDSLAFVVISPTVALPDYNPQFSEQDMRFLGLNRPQDMLMFNIVTIRSPDSATVNLKGPIVLNRRTLVGKQIIPLNAVNFPVKHPLLVVR